MSVTLPIHSQEKGTAIYEVSLSCHQLLLFYTINATQLLIQYKIPELVLSKPVWLALIVSANFPRGLESVNENSTGFKTSSS